jgi:hypothetical protein
VVSSVTVSAGGTLSAAGGVFQGTNALHGNFSLTATGNTINNFSVSSSTTISYDLRGVSASATTVMLQAATQQSTAQGAQYSVVVNERQQIGVYELSSNLMLANGTAFTLMQGVNALGSPALNGAGLTRNGVSYALQTTGAAGQVNLTFTTAFGAWYKGTSAANTLTGTAHSDIFYGGGGNDSISVGTGRDVLVYDTSNWGKDSIAASGGGTLALLFNGLNAADITAVKSGTNMIVSKKSDVAQTITVQNWNEDAHSLVYGGTLSAFNTWLNAASPTSAQQDAARNEVWQKTGLLA